MRQGEVYDLGYQHYTGPRGGRWKARKAIFENGVRIVLGIGRGGRSKILPALMFLGAIVPALIFIIILSVAEPAAASLPGPPEYYRVTSIILLLFGAISAPELLCSDRRNNVIHLYLVRPLTPTDYVLGRFLAFFVIVLALVYSGQVILQIGTILSSSEPGQYMQDNWSVVPKFLLSGFLVALFITSLPLAVATFTNRRMYVAAFVIGLFLVSTSIADGLTGLEDCPDQSIRYEVKNGSVRSDNSSNDSHCVPEYVAGDAAKWFSLVSIRDVPLRMNDMIFRVDSSDGPPAARAAAELSNSIHIGMYLLLTLGSIYLLWIKYQKVKT